MWIVICGGVLFFLLGWAALESFDSGKKILNHWAFQKVILIVFLFFLVYVVSLFLGFDSVEQMMRENKETTDPVLIAIGKLIFNVFSVLFIIVIGCGFVSVMIDLPNVLCRKITFFEKNHKKKAFVLKLILPLVKFIQKLIPVITTLLAFWLARGDWGQEYSLVLAGGLFALTVLLNLSLDGFIKDDEMLLNYYKTMGLINCILLLLCMFYLVMKFPAV